MATTTTTISAAMRAAAASRGRSRRQRHNTSLSLLIVVVVTIAIAIASTSTLVLVDGFSSPSTSRTRTTINNGNNRLITTTTTTTQQEQSVLFIKPTTRMTTTTTKLHAAATETETNKKFDIDTALFCAGLAFDSYVEPDPDSSRWERGSKGMNVAFMSTAFTRNLYRGMVEVTPIECTDLPEEDDTIESVATGNGVDVCLMCAIVEGELWKEDLKVLDNDPNHNNGIFDLSGSAHVGRSRTAWANVNMNKSKATKKKTGKGLPYHIPKAFLKSGKAVWPEDERPFYLYVQDPANVRLVFTIFDDDVIGEGSVISSASVALKELMPKVGEDLVETIKKDIVQKMVANNNGNAGELDVSKLNQEITTAIARVVDTDYKWEGDLKMKSKPKLENKNGQMAAGAAAGAMVAGPIGAAAGAAFGAFYEGKAKGVAKLKLRYLPVPPDVKNKNTLGGKNDGGRYEVLGGLPGINWGKLYELNLEDNKTPPPLLGGNDLEFCFFINHDTTGASVGVYRSLSEKRIVVSFRGTCQPIDMVTDASIFQVPWIAGEYDEQELSKKNIDHDTFPMVHVGFRKSMDSISRRLKTLVLASVAKGESITEYEVLVTGHSLGGALATLFTADIAESGIDAGRSLPQKAPSEPWWKGIASTFSSKEENNVPVVLKQEGPPRPKSLKMYNFGSPRAGNPAFANQFETYIEKGYIDEAYRIVNSQDIIARVPRPTGMLNVDYEHCGRTVLIEDNKVDADTVDVVVGTDTDPRHVLWIEGESDFERIDPVRDLRSATKGILSEGTLLDELVKTYKADGSGGEVVEGEQTGSSSSSVFSQLGAVASRLKKVDVADLTSVVGIDRSYANRELQLAQSFLKGESLAHHLEDSYYMAMGRAVGFNTTVGEDIVRV